MDQDQANRIEEKLDKALQQVATNTADIAWLKRAVTGVSSLFGLIHAYFFHRQS